MTVQEVLQRFGKLARPIMLPFMGRSSCIASTRTTVEVMRIFRLKAVEIPVSFVFEVPAKKYARISGFSYSERKKMAEKAANWRDEGVGTGWNGHLIALVENRWLIDAAIDQAHSEEFGVAIPPQALVIDTEGQHWNARAQFDLHLGLTLDNGDTARVQYRSIKNRGYLDTEAWNDEGLIFLADQIAAEMRGEP